MADATIGMTGMNAANPYAMPMTRRLDLAANWVTGLSRDASIAISAGVLAVVAVADFVAPTEYVFGPFYFLSVCLSAWSLGTRGGYTFALLTALVWTLLQIGHLGAADAVLWNITTRTLTNVAIAAMVGSMRRIYDREHSLGRTDGLTGALNRRAFHDAITAMLGRARRSKDVIVISYIDLDGFKAVNDQYGHAAGDDVLSAFALAAKAELAPHEALARVGGDEFVLIQVGHAGDNHFAMAEARHGRLTVALRQLPYPVTCSMGVVIAQGGRIDQEALVAMADSLLYEVKRAGKNALRIAVANDDDAVANDGEAEVAA